MNLTIMRSKWAAVGAAVAITLGAGGIGISHAETLSGEKPVYLPIEPCRLADTRPAPDTVGPRSAPLGADDTFTLSGWGTVGDCTLPSGATALALNVTAVGASTLTYLTIYPGAGTAPNASSLNPAPGQPPVPNAVNVDLDAAGEFSVFNKYGSVHVIIDVVGLYDDHDHDDRYYTETEIDAAVSTKANSADVYTTAQVDGRLAEKVTTDDGRSAYAWACDDSTTVGTPYDATSGCGYSFNPSGQPVTITREGTGVYAVNFPGLAMSGGHVQVSAYRGSSYCNVNSWDDSVVYVDCFAPGGAAANAEFTVLALD